MQSGCKTVHKQWRPCGIDKNGCQICSEGFNLLFQCIILKEISFFSNKFYKNVVTKKHKHTVHTAAIILLQALRAPALGSDTEEDDDDASSSPAAEDMESEGGDSGDNMDDATTLVLGENPEVARHSDLDGSGDEDHDGGESSDAGPACSNGVRHVDHMFDSPGSDSAAGSSDEEMDVDPLPKAPLISFCEMYYRDKKPCKDPESCNRCAELRKIYGASLATPPPKRNVLDDKLDKSAEKTSKSTKDATG